MLFGTESIMRPNRFALIFTDEPDEIVVVTVYVYYF